MEQRMSTIDEQFMGVALEEARAAAAEGEVPVGAVVVCAGQVVARAHNRREAEHDPSAHAEFLALTQAARALKRWRLWGCTVYVTLEPCLMCAGLMVNARVDRCVYGAADAKAGALGSLYAVQRDVRLNHAFEVSAGVRADECAQVLRAFFEDARARRREDADSLAIEASKGTSEDVSDSAAEKGATADLCCCNVGGLGGISAPHPQVLLAVDSFKGSATSAQAEGWIAEGIARALPEARVTAIPIADGGEGTAEAVHAARGGVWRVLRVQGPLGAEHEARFLLVDGGAKETPTGGVAVGAGPIDPIDGARTAMPSTAPLGSHTRRSLAVIEMAEAAGIGFSSRGSDDALAASTYGVGELMRAAVEEGARTLYIGLGGSATSDGGAGMLAALGARLLDAWGEEVPLGLMGLVHVASIDLEPAVRALEDVELVVLTDVDNPLVGERGAVKVFGLQKGLSGNLDTYDRWMIAYAQRLTEARDALDGTPWQVGEPGARPRSLAGVPGGGAAGGLGAALVALGARVTSGIQTVLDLVEFDDAARTADLVITGEGNMDEQTASGKAPVGVAKRAKAVRAGVPVVAVCGGRADNLEAVYATGIDMVLPAPRRPMALEQALLPAETHANLIAAGETAARAYLLGR